MNTDSDTPNPAGIVHVHRRRTYADLCRDAAGLILSKPRGAVKIETIDADGGSSIHSVAATAYTEYVKQLHAQGVQRIDLLVGALPICLYEPLPR